MTKSGQLRKMRASLEAGQVHYQLIQEPFCTPLNSLLGMRVRLEYRSVIRCTHCGRVTKKSYSQGHCYPCSQTLASCDLCIMKPERCHYAKGTCREPEWGLSHCMQPHIVYLADTSSVKVGITRATQLPTRWIDQGATQALPILRVASRQQSGLVEDALRAFIGDKTNWRNMLRGVEVHSSLATIRDSLLKKAQHSLQGFMDTYLGDIEILESASIIRLSYPVKAYPTKIQSLSFDKTNVIQGVLMGIKGQYLILDSGVINIRKFTGYEITFTHEGR